MPPYIQHPTYYAHFLHTTHTTLFSCTFWFARTWISRILPLSFCCGGNCTYIPVLSTRYLYCTLGKWIVSFTKYNRPYITPKESIISMCVEVVYMWDPGYRYIGARLCQIVVGAACGMVVVVGVDGDELLNIHSFTILVASLGSLGTFSLTVHRPFSNLKKRGSCFCPFSSMCLRRSR